MVSFTYGKNMKILFYLCPALMDWLVFFVMFAVFYSAGERGLAISECGWLGIVFWIIYALSSFIVGHVINFRNSGTVLFFSVCLSAVFSVSSLYFSQTWILYFSLGGLSASMGLFFNAFQNFMRDKAFVGNLRNSVALYTFSWCTGSAVGNLSSGSLYDLGFKVMTFAVLSAVILTISILLFLRKKDKDRVGTTPAPVEVNHQDILGRENFVYVYLGWTMIFTIVFVQRPLFTFLPVIFAEEGISAFAASLPLGIHMFMIGLLGLLMLMGRWRILLYHKTPIVCAHLIGILSLTALWLWPSYMLCLFMMIFLGIYGAFAFYSAVYYSSNSAKHSFNIGINEMLVGIGSIAGLFFGDWAITAAGSNWSMYPLCAGTILLSFIIQITILRLKKSPRPAVNI
jgi:MFS family permease